MLTRHLITNILDIRLEEEKFYFPGETIKGLVIVHPKSAIKVNAIQLKFYGQVYIHLKEKETTTLFQNTLVLSVYPNSTTPKQTILDACEHTFNFEFIVPKHLNLPSSMEFGKKGHIRYTINALLDRPMIPESLCPKMDYTVLLLEYIDIEQAQFKVPQEKSQDIMLPKAKYNQKCQVRASMPRLGFTRGDIVPIKVTVDHFTSFSCKKGVTVELVRTVEIRTSRHTVFKETVLKSTLCDIDILQDQLQQSIMCQLLIPTSTPPSIRYKDKVLRFHYKIRVLVSFTKKNICTLDMPIVIGTWPRAAVPIEDDEDEDDNESLRTCSIDDSCSIKTNSSILPYWHPSQVERSDSVTSNSSWKSSQSWEQQQYNNLSRNTSQSTTLSSPDRLPSYYTTNTCNQQTHHRSASSVYSTEYPLYNTNHMNRIRPPINNRLSRYSTRTDESIILQDVPTHILEPLSTNNNNILESASESSSFEDSEEDDLLAIIEKKKKKEKKELRKKSQQPHVDTRHI